MNKMPCANEHYLDQYLREIDESEKTERAIERRAEELLEYCDTTKLRNPFDENNRLSAMHDLANHINDELSVSDAFAEWLITGSTLGFIALRDKAIEAVAQEQVIAEQVEDEQ